MDRLIYIAAAGAQALLSRQDVLAGNLANVSTPGFRAELQALRAVPVRGDGASTRVYALETTVGYDARPGPVASTGRALDVAVQGNSWLAVQSLDGSEAYTRNGALQLDAQGQLVTASGLPVAGSGGGPITVPANASVDIAADGSIAATVAGQRPQVVGRLKLVTPEAPLERGADGLFRAADGELDVDPQARVQGAALEGSNVSPIESMIGMIAAARQFEQQIKALQGAEQRDQSAAKLLSAT
ncbi:MAG: flagellar basal-body rod protein FlgF [Proteobacteria bacterium]|nr:flagellar basal-body rod protein FlgF [Pseudomonadota bacterium]